MENPLERGRGLVTLRGVERGDLEALYLMQSDAAANEMAVSNPRDRGAFDEFWDSVLGNGTITARVIVVDGRVVGHISCFEMEGRDTVGYWIERESWGRGIGTRALELLLNEVRKRPLHASTAKGNAGSRRVLEKCGFALTGYRWAPATERFPACEEAMFVLE